MKQISFFKNLLISIYFRKNNKFYLKINFFFFLIRKIKLVFLCLFDIFIKLNINKIIIIMYMLISIYFNLINNKRN